MIVPRGNAKWVVILGIRKAPVIRCLRENLTHCPEEPPKNASSWISPSFYFCIFTIWSCWSYQNVWYHGYFSLFYYDVPIYTFQYIPHISNNNAANIPNYLVCCWNLYFCISWLGFIHHQTRLSTYFPSMEFCKFHELTFGLSNG